jgi:hypothetical protein
LRYIRRNLLLASFAEVESILEGEAVLAQAHWSIFHAIGAISVNASAPAGDAWLRRIHMHQQLFLSQLSAVTGRFPSSAISAAKVVAAFKSSRADPSPDNLQGLIFVLMETARDLEELTEKVRRLNFLEDVHPR